jgi:Protein of unknown function (DUF1254)
MSHLRDHLACLVRVNVLDNTVRLAGPNSTSVADPNDGTLYSTAFLDLRAGPQLLRVPPVSGRYVDFQLLDIYTDTIADVGVLTDGGHGCSYAFVGPGWHGTIPEGVVRIDVPTPDAWLLGRTQVKGPADLLAAVELEAQYSLTALSGHGSGTIGGPSTLACPAPTLPSSTSLAFLADLEKTWLPIRPLPPTARLSRPWLLPASARDERPEPPARVTRPNTSRLWGSGPASWPEQPVKAPPQSGPDTRGVPWWDRVEPTT